MPALGSTCGRRGPYPTVLGRPAPDAGHTTPLARCRGHHMERLREHSAAVRASRTNGFVLVEHASRDPGHSLLTRERRPTRDRGSGSCMWPSAGGRVPSPSTPSASGSRLTWALVPASVPVMFRRPGASGPYRQEKQTATLLVRASSRLTRTHVRSLARRKPGVQIPSPPPTSLAGQSVAGHLQRVQPCSQLNRCGGAGCEAWRSAPTCPCW